MSDALRFGWFIPTSGDTTAIGDPAATIPPDIDHFVRVARTAEAAGFEYALVPVQTACFEAWVTCAMLSAHTQRLKMLVAARPGYIAPAVMAKMVTTFDQLSRGRIFVNLIAGPGGEEEAREGGFYDHDERYEIMDETVTLMKRLWTEAAPVTYHGKHFRIEHGIVRPQPFQTPHPPFYIGGISPAAQEVGAKHADVYLFWGDTPQAIAGRIASVRETAAKYGRAETIGFGMRLQVLVRETEEQAWRDAEALIGHATDGQRAQIRAMWNQSQANSRMKVLAQAENFRVGPHLWSGISSVRPGAGVAVVGNPEQVAATIQEFADLGCRDFCLSGYPHDAEAERFGRLVLPLLRRSVVRSQSRP
jgi:alkanesulfonate monooxygenase